MSERAPSERDFSPDRELPSHPDAGVPRPGFSVRPQAAELPGYDPSDSPLVQGGLSSSPQPAPADASLVGLVRREMAGQPRVVYRVRREGWVARRSQARNRFRSIHSHGASSTPRLLAGLDRRGLLERSKAQAVRPRFNLRGLP